MHDEVEFTRGPRFITDVVVVKLIIEKGRTFHICSRMHHFLLPAPFKRNCSGSINPPRTTFSDFPFSLTTATFAVFKNLSGARYVSWEQLAQKQQQLHRILLACCVLEKGGISIVGLVAVECGLYEEGGMLLITDFQRRRSTPLV